MHLWWCVVPLIVSWVPNYISLGCVSVATCCWEEQTCRSIQSTFWKAAKIPVSFVVYVPSCVLNTKSQNCIHVLLKVPLCPLDMACDMPESSVSKGPWDKHRIVSPVLYRFNCSTSRHVYLSKYVSSHTVTQALAHARPEAHAVSEYVCQKPHTLTGTGHTHPEEHAYQSVILCALCQGLYQCLCACVCESVRHLSVSPSVQGILLHLHRTGHLYSIGG
jgi:hypothetical protein